MGITDYELGVIPFNIFKREYARTGRGVVEQVLNMTAEEKQTLYNALIETYSPKNEFTGSISSITTVLQKYVT